MSTQTPSSETETGTAALRGMGAPISENLAGFAATGLILVNGLSAVSVNFGEGPLVLGKMVLTPSAMV